MECVYLDLAGGGPMGLFESPALGRKYLVGNSVFHGKYLV